MFDRLSELCPELCEMESESNNGSIPQTAEGERNDHYSQKNLSPLRYPPRLARSLLSQVSLLHEFCDSCRFAENIIREISQFR